MKKQLFFFLGFLLTVNISIGQILTEDFNYTAGQLLTSNGWAAHSGAGTNALTVTSPGLTYTGHPGSGIGNAVTMTTSGEDVNKTFTSVTSGSVYMSFLVNLSAAQATGDYFIGLFQTSAIFPVRIYAKSDGVGGFFFGVSKGNSTIAYETTARSFATTYFIVANYIFNGATTLDDVINLWVNPALGGTETTATIPNVTGTSTDATSIAAAYLRQGTAANASTQQVDAIIVGTTWASVTPAAAGTPALTAGTVADFGNITVSTQSTSQSFNLSGSNLTGAPGNITITAPSTDFEVSNDNNTWGANTTIAFSSATLASTPVYVRFTPQSTGLKSGNLSITGGGASTTVAVSGTGAAAAPPAAPVATAATTVGGNTFTANWNAVSGATNYLLDVYTVSGTTSTDTVSGWYFPVNTSASLTAGIGNINNAGIQTVSNTGASQTFSYPAGPSGSSGSPNPYSVSTNTWDNGADAKYWQINVNTTGATNINLSSLQGSSNTGPRDFKVQYRVGASGTWTDVAGGVVTLTTAVAAGNLATWGSIANLALPADASNQPLVSIRWIQTSNTAINASPVASGGTSRISAIYVRGDVGSTSATYIHQNLSVGNVTSYDVSGLTPNTTYYYVVRAENGNGVSSNSNEISVTTTAAVTPVLSATTLNTFGDVCINTTAGPNSFIITGTSLTATNVDVAALPGFTYSTSSGGTYTSSLSLPQAGGAFSQEVFVKFDPTAVQSYNGDIVVSGGGASSVNVATTGSGVNSMPAVTSGAASAVTQTSATVAGTITATGCSAITAYGIEWSTTSGFANGSGTPVASSNLAGGNFSADLIGLASGTTYYYHAYATNAGGTAYGAELSFATISPNPFITTSALTSFGDICIGTIAGPNSFTITGTNLTNVDINVGPLTGYIFSVAPAGPYTASLILPQPGGSYSETIYVQFMPALVQSYNGDIPVNGGGISAVVNVTVTGAGVNTTPTVATGAASAITTTTATLAGNFTLNGCTPITVYGIEYSTTNGFANGSGTQVVSTNETVGNYTADVSGLTASTTYYYKAYATNAGGTSYGVQQSFTTLAPPPPALNATALTGFGTVCVGTTAGPNSFTINGTNLTTAPIMVGPLAGFAFSETAAGPYANSISINQSGGTQAKTVYVTFSPVAAQSYTGNIPITGGGTTGTLNIAVTGSGGNTSPSVTTGGASNIFTHYATLAGTITANGCSNVTGYGIEISGVNGFADGTGTKTAGSNLAGGNFSVTLNNLVQGATYYYKAYATNSGGTGYGAQQSFTVGAIPDAFTIFPVPAAPGSEVRFSMKNIPAGNYSLLLFNSQGAQVFQYNMNIQANFINQAITLPGTLGRGVYQIQLRNTNGTLAKKSILIL